MNQFVIYRGKETKIRSKIRESIHEKLGDQIQNIRAENYEQIYFGILQDEEKVFQLRKKLEKEIEPGNKLEIGDVIVVNRAGMVTSYFVDLLKLLISMADSRCPILIDQPEDDLDNRSIFDELIPFIREKKIVRQILIVTHNANVVLGGDAEEIIVANQDGNNSPNAKFRFEYRSGSIENDTPILNLNGEKQGVLNEKGIQQHICDVLEGGERAFDLRKRKYRI